MTRFRLSNCECEIEADFVVAALGIVLVSNSRHAVTCRIHAEGRRYEPGEVPAREADTSREAGARVESHREADERRLLIALSIAPAGLGAFQAAELLGMEATSSRPRLSEMARYQPALVRDSGERRKIRTGRPGLEIVWQITEAGRAALAGRAA